MSLADREEDIALKSLVMTDEDGLRLFISFKSCSEFDKND